MFAVSRIDRDMIGSRLMTGLSGPKLLDKEKDFIVSNRMAGVALFKRNIESFEQTGRLCAEIKSLTTPPPLIAVDLEGGSVNRFSHLKERPKQPSPQVLGTFPPEEVFSIARKMGYYLRHLGIDINFAPVVDLLLTNSPLLNSRVFGRAKKEILQSAKPFIEGLLSEGIIPCLKHFPGHGGTGEDSHKSLPKDKRREEDLKEQFYIFRSLFQKYPSCWIMTAHIEFTNIDRQPASFSAQFLKEQLRKKDGFKGILISDDIDMSALKAFSPEEKFARAIKGGCDLVLACQKTITARKIVEYFRQNPEKKKEIEQEIQLRPIRL